MRVAAVTICLALPLSLGTLTTVMFSVVLFTLPSNLPRLVVVVVMRLDIHSGSAVLAWTWHQFAALNQHTGIAAAVRLLPGFSGQLAMRRSLISRVRVSTLPAIDVVAEIAFSAALLPAILFEVWHVERGVYYSWNRGGSSGGNLCLTSFPLLR